MSALPHRILIAVLVLLPGVTSCGDDPAVEPTSDPPSPAALVVTPGTVLFTALGDTLRLAAEVQDQQGRPMSGAAVSVAPPNLPPNFMVDEGTSHALQFAGLHVAHYDHSPLAVAYADYR